MARHVLVHKVMGTFEADPWVVAAGFINLLFQLDVADDSNDTGDWCTNMDNLWWRMRGARYVNVEADYE